MPHRKGSFVADNVYHVYNRGCAGERIFVQSGNYVYLLRKVKQLLREIPVTIIAYCLMPTHYHFILCQDGDQTISVFIERLFKTYSQAFNKRQGRRGPLFEGQFEHVHVDSDEYLIHVCRYVHLNPVEAGLVAQPKAWPYSNYLEWTEEREGALVDRELVRSFFATSAAYTEFVLSEIAPEIARELEPYLLDHHLPGS